MLDKTTVINTIEQYAAAVAKEFDPAAVVLYGSHAKGMAHEDSDIDVAVIFNGFSGDWLTVASSLWRIAENISLSIEPVLLDRTQDKSGFADNILKTGYMVYTK